MHTTIWLIKYHRYVWPYGWYWWQTWSQHRALLTALNMKMTQILTYIANYLKLLVQYDPFSLYTYIHQRWNCNYWKFGTFGSGLDGSHGTIQIIGNGSSMICVILIGLVLTGPSIKTQIGPLREDADQFFVLTMCVATTPYYVATSKFYR